MTEAKEPVRGFPIKFRWQTNELLKIFDEQVSLIKGEIARAQADDRVIVYLSCPISSRGGGYYGTNVDIAKHIEHRLMADWGHRFWILNPARYQLESKEGTGLMQQHARKLGIKADKLKNLKPHGGDNMRMWTRVLIEDNVDNTARDFDMFYFIGPTDVRDFFTSGGAVTVTAGIEEYFARKFTIDPDFRDYYSTPGIIWGVDKKKAAKKEQQEGRDVWERGRKNFFRYYAVLASANFSLGCHDEWNIFRLINQKRLERSADKKSFNGDVGEMLAGFFDRRQIDPGAAVTQVSPGYEDV